MGRRRVVVTGLGAICALGQNIAEMWAAVCEGRSGIAPIHSVDVSDLRFQNGAQVPGYDCAQHFEANRAIFLDPFSQFAVIAARQAIQNSGITLTLELRENTAIVTGSGLGGQSTLGAGLAKLYLHEPMRIDGPLVIPRAMANAGASHISMEFGITGPAYTVSTACCSANHAIGQAFRMVRDGDVELAIAGGSEAPFGYGLLKAFEAMRVVSPDTCRPFSKGRRGFILGEGGAMLVLEPLDAALARGATIHAEVVGFGMSSDAQHITQLSVDGPVRAMRAALRDAGLAPEQIGYINAHGSATLINDCVETRAIRAVFGQHAEGLLCRVRPSRCTAMPWELRARWRRFVRYWRWRMASFRRPRTIWRQIRVAISTWCPITLVLHKWSVLSPTRSRSEAITRCSSRSALHPGLGG